MNRIFLALAIGTLFLVGPNLVAYGDKEASLSVEGKVIKATEEAITLNPQPGLFYQEINLGINNKTKYEAFTSLQDLQKGDRVKVEYYEQDGKKVASQITKVGVMNKDQT